MKIFFLSCAALFILYIFPMLYRVIKGPTTFDRLLAINAITTKVIIISILLGFAYGRLDMFIDVPLAYAILGFLGTIATAKYLISKKAGG